MSETARGADKRFIAFPFASQQIFAMYRAPETTTSREMGFGGEGGWTGALFRYGIIFGSGT